MRSTCGLAVATFLLAVTGATWCLAADPPAINPVGKPKGFGAGKQTEYAIWYGDGAWHIRATTVKGTKARFSGSVFVEGGQFVGGDFDQLESKRRSASSDWVAIDRPAKEMRFIFGNAGGRDGVDFQVSESARKVRFGLLLGSDTSPQNVLIGRSGVHPATIPFELPAHPDDAPEPPAKKKKKAND
jgi:hypothetical protein